MKYTIGLFLLIVVSPLLAQENYWQQKLHYTINAELNDKDKTITGTETIIYKNNSPQSLDFIWFHIWPNAYSNDSTALMKQIKKDPELSAKGTKLSYGHIEGLSFKVNDKAAETKPHENPQYVDVIKLILNNPLAPGDSISISTPFKVFLPEYFSRSGYSANEFMACQWYPKPAVFDASGWHAFPYLDMGEFYSEYADFNVSLTVPANYVVGATGTLLTVDELKAYKTIGAKNAANRKKSPTPYTPITKKATKTLQYTAKQVPDFAWFADKDFVIQYDTVRLKSGKVVDAFSFYHDAKKTLWNNSIDFIKDAIHKYSGWIGEYEYPVVQVVEGPQNNSSGGMEYPMITLITAPNAEEESLDAVITHEVGHNWFMSMLGSNERDHTWMDEGLNTYYQFRYEGEKYRSNSIFGNSLPKELKKLPADQFLQVIYTTIEKHLPMQSAMDIPADKFPSSAEYGIVSYVKTALWMYILESAIGQDQVDLAVKNYFQKWKHKHPQPVDMENAFESATGKDLTDFFLLTKKEGKFE
ncbi:M1 family metallopeptidase [Pseudochryseolinea flava]|uniref:M1 family peptidase n=1 Tax=Pseudochryseolinea flava TaxID=2059302 RepID=A0A364Y670_9BACT|nr:M1 family metallopeptidase [Pseudochryseolinea flava]RAW02369.1 M1 family peptidase [Pseudochryseolinea flava]